MADDLIQQAAANAPAAGVGGGAAGLVVAISYAIKLLTGPKDAAALKDIELAKAEIRAEMAEKYAQKDEIAKIDEKLNYITQRIDQIFDKK